MADNRLPCFLIGTGIGAVFGLLVAPKKGSETRADLLQAVEHGHEFVTRNSPQWQEYADAALNRGRQILESQREHLQSALDAGMKAYQKANEDAP